MMAPPSNTGVSCVLPSGLGVLSTMDGIRPFATEQSLVWFRLLEEHANRLGG